MKQAAGDFNRGALLNAAYLHVASQCPEVDTFVFMDPDALFNTDFAARYFGADGKDVVDYGKLLDMPLSWALKVSKEVFEKVNGFPNNMATGGENEAFEHRLRISGVPVYTPTARPMVSAPKKEAKAKTDVRGALVVDALQWRLDGVKTLQYAVTQIQVGDWTVEPATDDANLRTLTVRLSPDAEVADLPQKKLDEADATKGAETKEEDLEGGADEEPPHLKDIELAYVHTTEMGSAGGGMNVVNVLDDDLNVGHTDNFKIIGNTDTMPTDQSSDVKKISFDLK